MTEQAADTAVDTACRLLRLPTIRAEFPDIATAAAEDQMTALTALRAGDSESFVSDLLGDVIPEQFLEEAGMAVLRQVSEPIGALVRGFITAFEAVATAYDETGAEPHTDGILQELALRLAGDDLGRPGGGVRSVARSAQLSCAAAAADACSGGSVTETWAGRSRRVPTW